MSALAASIQAHVANASLLALAWDLFSILALLHFLNKLRKVRLGALLKFVPGLDGKIHKQIDDETRKAVADLFKPEMTTSADERVPDKGMAPEQVLEHLKKLQKSNADAQKGRIFAYVYDPLQEGISKCIHDAAHIFMEHNALSPMTFPALRKMEVDVATMALNLQNAPVKEGAVGCMTSGGSESILMALKAYRERAAAKGIQNPEVILCVTAHGAFPKGCHMFGIKTVYVPHDKAYQVDVAAIRKAITKNTCLLVASAPQYPHGIIDPIEAVAALAAEHDIPCHVDACVGGFILPWIEKCGFKLPLWDYRVKGVTSISADLHKYGFASKGASVLTFRSSKDRYFQFYACAHWPGGLFVSPGLAGTRSGGPIAAAWAALKCIGADGYMSLAKTMMETSYKFQDGVNAIKGLEIIGQPQMTLVAFRPTDPAINVYVLSDLMQKRGWTLEKQHKPDSIHCTLMPTHARIADQFLVDLKECVAETLAHPELKNDGSAAMYGMVAKVPDESIVDKFLCELMNKIYAPAVSVEERKEAKKTD